MRLLKTQVETLRAIASGPNCPTVQVVANRLGIPPSSAANRVRILISQGRVMKQGYQLVLTLLGQNELEKEKT